MIYPGFFETKSGMRMSIRALVISEMRPLRVLEKPEQEIQKPYRPVTALVA